MECTAQPAVTFSGVKSCTWLGSCHLLYLFQRQCIIEETFLFTKTSHRSRRPSTAVTPGAKACLSQGKGPRQWTCLFQGRLQGSGPAFPRAELQGSGPAFARRSERGERPSVAQPGQDVQGSHWGFIPPSGQLTLSIRHSKAGCMLLRRRGMDGAQGGVVHLPGCLHDTALT